MRKQTLKRGNPLLNKEFKTLLKTGNRLKNEESDPKKGETDYQTENLKLFLKTGNGPKK